MSGCLHGWPGDLLSRRNGDPGGPLQVRQPFPRVVVSTGSTSHDGKKVPPSSRHRLERGHLPALRTSSRILWVSEAGRPQRRQPHPTTHRHPWAHEPEGGWSGSNVSVSHVVRHRQGSGFDGLGWVPLGPKRARQGPVWSRMGPYISRTPIRDSRVIRQGSSGPVGPYRVPTGFRRNPVLARRDPTGLDGSLDCPVSVHD